MVKVREELDEPATAGPPKNPPYLVAPTIKMADSKVKVLSSHAPSSVGSSPKHTNRVHLGSGDVKNGKKMGNGSVSINDRSGQVNSGIGNGSGNPSNGSHGHHSAQHSASIHTATSGTNSKSNHSNSNGTHSQNHHVPGKGPSHMTPMIRHPPPPHGSGGGVNKHFNKENLDSAVTNGNGHWMPGSYPRPPPYTQGYDSPPSTIHGHHHGPPSHVVNSYHHSKGGPRGQSPSRPGRGRYTPSPQSRGSSPSHPRPPGPPPPTTLQLGPGQHIVHLHVNPGATISFSMGEQMHVIHGPATVPWVSTNSSPPIPIPVQVPPGHMLQEIVDETGTLRHVILSPQPLVPMAATYGPASGPAPSTGQPPQPFYPPQGYPLGPYPHPYGSPLQTGVMGPMATAAQQGPSPPPAHNYKDERTHRQYTKLKKKLEQKREQRSDSSSISRTPPLSPKKDNNNGNIQKYKDQNTSMSGFEDGEESSVQEEEEAEKLLTQLLSDIKPPKITEITSRSALLQWQQPNRYGETGENKYADFDISDTEFKYEVMLSDRGRDGKYKCVVSDSPREYRLADLRPATEYFLYSFTLFDHLKGSPSEKVSFSTLASEPDPPVSPKLVVRSKTSLQLRWNAPSDNGAHITHYILEYDEGKGGGFTEVFKGRAKQHTITKLQSSTSYRFRLAAVNEHGKSAYSNVVKWSTSGSPPSQPMPPVLKESSVKQLHLMWQKRPHDDDFIMQMDDKTTGHGFLPVYNGPDVQFVCRNLQRNMEYRFRLQAHNEEGPSQWSEDISYQTLPERPSPPSKPLLKGKVCSSCFRVRWDPPSDNGGSDVTMYVLEIDAGNGFEVIYKGLDMEFLCDRLVPGTTYRVHVSCVSAGGHSEVSDTCVITTEPVCPGQCAPPRLHGKPKAVSLHLKWAYPDYDGGAVVNEFQVDMTSPDNTTRQVYKGRDTECIVASLLPGRPYLFQVRACNRAGPSPWSEPLEVVSGAGPPDRPKEPRIVCRSAQTASVSWEEPLNNGATITDYKLQLGVGIDPVFSSLFQGAGQTYEVKGLLPATLYHFRVQAVNSAGAGPFSPEAQCTTPPSSPAVVTNIRHTTSCMSISLSWKVPDAHGSEILHYNIDTGEKMVPTTGSPVEYLVDGLLPDTMYRIRIQAVNAVGPGPFSSVIKCATKPLPPAPPKLECIAFGHNYLKLKWGDGKNPNFTQYTLEMKNSNSEFSPVYQGTSHTHKVNKLQERTEHTFRIFAKNDAGVGQYSELHEYKTLWTPPPQLKAPKTSEVSETSCQVEWTLCKLPSEDTVLYQLQLLRPREQDAKVVFRGSTTQFQLSELEQQTEYTIRVCPIRQSSDGEVVGPYSPATCFTTTSREPLKVASSKSSLPPLIERKPLTDQQKAVIIVCVFTLVAVLAAVITQQIFWGTSS